MRPVTLGPLATSTLRARVGMGPFLAQCVPFVLFIGAWWHADTPVAVDALRRCLADDAQMHVVGGSIDDREDEHRRFAQRMEWATATTSIASAEALVDVLGYLRISHLPVVLVLCGTSYHHVRCVCSETTGINMLTSVRCASAPAAAAALHQRWMDIFSLV